MVDCIPKKKSWTSIFFWASLSAVLRKQVVCLAIRPDAVPSSYTIWEKGPAPWTKSDNQDVDI